MSHTSPTPYKELKKYKTWEDLKSTGKNTSSLFEDEQCVFSMEGKAMKTTIHYLTYPYILTNKRRRDSRHWWRRALSRIHRKELIVKAVYVVMISYLAALCVVFDVYSNDGISLLWVVFVIAGVIPKRGNEKDS